MTETATAKNALRRHAKQPFEVTAGIVSGFCQGEPITVCADRLGLTTRTVRETYHALRDRLMRPAFARWHPRDVVYANLKAQAEQDIRWTELLEALASCHANRTCWNNYQSGKRQSRRCRKCPLSDRYGDDAEVEKMIHVADSTRLFYDRMGWGKERRDANPAALLEKSIFHESILIKASEHTQGSAKVGFDLTGGDELSLGQVYRLLMRNLKMHPL